MSLLDDVSIVVTPNAYKAGTLYGVLPTYAEGSELITNGGFDTDSNWGKGTGWSINTTTKIAECDGSQSANTNLNPSVAPSIVNNQTYLLSLDVTLSAGTLSVFAFSSGVVLSKSSTGTSTLTLYFTKGAGGNLYIQGNADFIGSVDNVSIKEVTSSDMDVTRATAATRVDENGLVNYAQVLGSEQVINGDFDTDSNWNKGANTTISGGKLNSNSAGVYIIASQVPTPVILPNKVYKYSITYTITSGSVRFGDSHAVFSGSLQSTSGTYTNIVTSSSSANGQIYITSPSSDFVGSVDNISVKEVTRNNVPRIDYTGGGCPHILAEPQRTNLITYSEDFSNSYWQKSGATVTSGIVSPDGTTNSFKLVEDTSTGRHEIQAPSSSSGNLSTSFFAKKGENSFIQITNSEDANAYANFDLNSGVLGSSNVFTPTIIDYGNGWYRCIATINAPLAINFARIGLITSSTSARVESYTGNGSSGLYIYGAQLEAGTYRTSYIPTSGSTVTRNADIFQRDGITSLIGQTAGTIYWEIDVETTVATANENILNIDAGSFGNTIYFIKTATGNITTEIYVSGSVQASFTKTNITKGVHKIALGYANNNTACFIDGVQVGVNDTSCTIPATNRVQFGSGAIGVSDGKIKNLQLYKTRLTNTQLAALTT